MSVHPFACVSPEARLGAGVEVGPYAVIEPGAVVGDGCEIRAHAVVKRFTTLGAGNRVHEHAVLGGEPQDLSFEGGPSRLVIGNRNVIREGVTVHRATRPGGETVIGDDCFLMAYAHVAHENRIGSRVVIANNVALAGHVELADQSFLGGGAGIHQFCRVGRLAMIGGNAKIVKDCLPFVVTDGAPARARGLNLVGLRRAGVAPAQRSALKEAYRLLLRSGLRLEEALERIGRLQDPLADEMAAFARGGRRGFHRSASRAFAIPG